MEHERTHFYLLLISSHDADLVYLFFEAVIIILQHTSCLTHPEASRPILLPSAKSSGVTLARPSIAPLTHVGGDVRVAKELL